MASKKDKLLNSPGLNPWVKGNEPKIRSGPELLISLTPEDLQNRASKREQTEESKISPGSTLLIPIREIEVCPQSSGRPSEPTDIEDLKQSIAENGLIQNIVVCLTAPGSKYKYRLIAGHRRRMACLALSKTEIEAKVLDLNPEDLTAIEAVQLIENIQNKALTALEEARGLLSLKSRSGLSDRQLSEKLGVKRGTLQDSLKIANWYSELVAARAATSSGVNDDQELGVAARAATPLVDVENWSRRSLLTLARVDNPVVLDRILPKAGDLSTRELEKLIKKEQERFENPSESGPKKAKIGAGALIKAYYNEALKNTANIKVDEAQLLEIQRQLSHFDFAETLTEVKDYAVRLCNVSISKLFPGLSFIIEMTIKVPDFEKATKRDGASGSDKEINNNINNTGYFLSDEETEIFNHINQELSKYENFLSRADFAEALKKMTLPDIINEYHLLPYRYGAAPGILFREALSTYGTSQYPKVKSKTKNKKLADLKPIPGFAETMACAICAGQGIIQSGPKSGSICDCSAGQEIRKESQHD